MVPENESEIGSLTGSAANGVSSSCNETISRKGFRFTAQRREVYDALLVKRDHPTAVDVFMRVQKKLPGISLATVYNCLETLTECGLARAVNHDRQPSRYCANLEPHAHFFCEVCGAVEDVPAGAPGPVAAAWQLPAGAVITDQEVAFRGQCAECAAKNFKS
jgi:Fur family peroxide stress response transcriptional regulator